MVGIWTYKRLKGETERDEKRGFLCVMVCPAGNLSQEWHNESLDWPAVIRNFIKKKSFKPTR